MAWNEIIGQDKVKNLMQGAIIDNKVAHAYCFVGMEGTGKEAIAIEFAKTVNCEQPIIKDTAINACGVCPSCRMSKILQHPNIQLVYSLPTGKAGESKSDNPADRLTDEQINEIQEQNALKAENPYYRIRITKSSQIRIASIRDIKRSLSFTQSSYGRRVIIVSRADEMTTEAANAFLKTLEEPQRDITLIITTSKPEAILPTILSRCQQVHFQPLPFKDLENYLIDRYKLDSTEAALAATFSQGSVSNALEFLDMDMKQHRNEVIDILRTALKKRVYRVELLQKLDIIIKEKDRNKVNAILTILLIWLRDSLVLIKTGITEEIINKDQLGTIQNFSNNFAKKEIHKAIVFIEAAINHNKKNVNQQLLLINTFIKIRNVLLN